MMKTMTKRGPSSGEDAAEPHGGLRVSGHPQLQDPKHCRALMRAADQVLDAGDDATAVAAERALFRGLHACGAALAMAGRGSSVGARRARIVALQRRIVDYLVASHTGLVYEMRRRVRRAEWIDDDAYDSAGFWALYQSILAYDPWRGFRFSTYACNAIVRAYQGVWRRNQARERRLRKYVEAHADRLGVIDRGAPAAAWAETDETMVGVLRRHAAQLTPTERVIIFQRFLTADSGTRPTLASVGGLVRLSKERVRQIQNAALAKLRVALAGDRQVAAWLEAG
ncbi:MAG TPA: sigma factor-like helix-turn-helix DNA-binding protein [Phycisphaerae bacterium]|nr:sigma factor-like helix-turn-helix DNA-binding protein [Phycisphaerae bacterium]